MDLTSLLHYAFRISSFSIFVPLIVGLFYYRTFKYPLKVLFYYTVFSAIIEMSAMYLGTHKINNLFLSHIYIPIEFAVFSFIYFGLFFWDSKKTMYILTISIFFLIALVDVGIVTGPKKMNELSRNVEGITLITFAVIYFIKTINHATSNTIALTSTFSFWFNTGIIVYISGSFFVFLFSNYMLATSPDTFFAVYTIHSLFNIIFHILLAIAFTKKIQ